MVQSGAGETIYGHHVRYGSGRRCHSYTITALSLDREACKLRRSSQWGYRSYRSSFEYLFVPLEIPDSRC